MATHISELIIKALNPEIGDITISKTGARNAPIGRGTDLKTIRFVLAQKPTLTTPFTPMAFDDGTRVSLDIRADDDLEKSIKALDEKIRTECPLLGQRVVITGTSREDLNGRTGVATSFDHARGRYVVELDSKEGEKEKERLKVKPQNLSTQTARKQGKKKGPRK